MKTIFHIGLPKTGTTSLQNSLHGAREALLRHGVLYPSLERFGHLNHHPLILGVLPHEKLPRQFRFKRARGLERLSSRAIAEVSRSIAATRPAHLVLSSEYFSREFRPDEAARLRSLVGTLGVTDLVFSVYIRRPSAHYLSLLTQSLRQSSTMRPLQPFRVRPRLERLAAIFPEARIVPAVFSREALTGGDIVTDFVDRFLVPLGVAQSEVPVLVEANVSVSGESSALLMAFRRDFYPGQDHRPERGATALFHALAKIEMQLGPRRPRLRPEIARYIDAATDDLLWLRDAYGLTFPGVDIGVRNPAAPPVVTGLSDVVETDRDYLDAILSELARSSWARRPWRRAWIRSIAAGEAPAARRAGILQSIFGV